jgi:hypothetical protein
MSEPLSSIRAQLRVLLPLSLTGIALGVSSALIVLSHPVEPVEPPLPVVDLAATAPFAEEDRAARAKLELTPAPPAVRAIGTAFLEWNEGAARMHGESDEASIAGRESIVEEIHAAMREARAALGAEVTDRELAALRSYHVERFLEELGKFRREGQPSAELQRLGGGLLGLLQGHGWIGPQGELHVPPSVLRARYKLFWTSVVYSLRDCDRVEPQECYALTTLPLPLPELRALLAFLVTHPVLRQEDRDMAPTLAAAEDHRRMVYLDRMAALDAWAAKQKGYGEAPFLGGFPATLARGAMQYRLGKYEDALETLTGWLREHPEDARAHNWRLAAVSRVHGE